MTKVFSATILGQGSLIKKLLDMKITAQKELRAEAFIAAKMIESIAKRKINTGARTGRTYIRRQGGVHRASAPGEPPKTDTGALANSIATRIEKESTSGVTVLVGSFGNIDTKGVSIGWRLEKKMNRPWLQPSLDEARPKIKEKLKRLKFL